jgi:hypothetical protein
MTDRKVGDFLQELMALAPKSGKHAFVRERAEHAYESFIKLMKLMRESYPASDAADLEKRFINSVKTEDFRKFKRGLNRIIAEERESQVK